MDIGLDKIKNNNAPVNPDINHTANKPEQTVARQYPNRRWTTLESSIIVLPHWWRLYYVPSIWLSMHQYRFP